MIEYRFKPMEALSELTTPYRSAFVHFMFPLAHASTIRSVEATIP